MKKLFGKKKDKTANGDVSSSNPYATSPAGSDPYMNGGPPSNPPPYQSVAEDSFRREKSPAVTGPGGSYGGGYGNSSGGAAGGYGRSQPYGSANGAAPAPRRPGGYGGLGRANSDDTMATDAGRDALFGNAPKRTQQTQPPPASGVNRVNDGYAPQVTDDKARTALFGNGRQKQPQYQPSGRYGASGASGTAGDYSNGGYGGYDDREKTAEEIEEEEVVGAKQEIRFIKQEGVSSLDRSLQQSEMAIASAQSALGNLVTQGESLSRTQDTLISVSAQNKIAAENTKVLSKTNASMLYRGSAKKANERDMEKMADRQRERDEREGVKSAAYQNRMLGQQHQTAGGNGYGARQPQRNLLERSKFQFEGEDSDDELEDAIDSRMDRLGNNVHTLHGMATDIGRVAEAQISQIDDIHRRTDKVDDQFTYNKARLDRIH